MNLKIKLKKVVTLQGVAKQKQHTFRITKEEKYNY